MKKKYFLKIKESSFVSEENADLIVRCSYSANMMLKIPISCRQ